MTSEADSTPVTVAASDAVTSLSTDDGVSTKGSTQQLAQETSSSLSPPLGKLHLENDLSYVQVMQKYLFVMFFPANFEQWYFEANS